MKKSELVLGNVIKAYKGETEYTITNITEEVVTLNDLYIVIWILEEVFKPLHFKIHNVVSYTHP